MSTLTDPFVAKPLSATASSETILDFDLAAILRGDGGADATGPRRDVDRIAEHVNPAFAKTLKTIGFDIDWAHGRGAYLYDQSGQRYIDCLGGYAVFNVGRNHPVVRDALRQAMDADLPNLVKMGAARLSGVLAERLVAIAPKHASDASGDPLDTVFFCNSGAEGVETAIKYARAATGRASVLYCHKAFHGLTCGALGINGNAEFRDGFGTTLSETVSVPFNDLDALERELATQRHAAFMVEPIQGKGVNVPDDGYLSAAAELCRKHGTLFVADEVQTGFGRTGRMFAVEHWNVVPDVLITAKALSGGYVPVGAVISKRWIHRKVFPSMDQCVRHSTTFGQNDLAMAAGLATLHVLEGERLVDRARGVGGYFLSKLNVLVERYAMVKAARGKGLMVALEFGPPSPLRYPGLATAWHTMHQLDGSLFPQAVLIPLLQDHRVLAQTAGHHQDTIKFIPPLVLSREDVDVVVAGLDACIAACHRFPGPAWEIGKRLAKAAAGHRSVV